MAATRQTDDRVTNWRDITKAKSLVVFDMAPPRASRVDDRSAAPAAASVCPGAGRASARCRLLLGLRVEVPAGDSNPGCMPFGCRPVTSTVLGVDPSRR